MSCHRFTQFFRAAVLFALLGAVSPAFALNLPVLPPCPAPGDLVKYDAPNDTRHEDELRKMLEEYNQYVRIDLPRLMEECKASAERTAAGNQLRLRSADGKKLLFLTEDAGQVTQVKYYELTDPLGVRINHDRSYSLDFYNRIILFAGREGRSLGLAMEGAPRLDSFSNVIAKDKSYIISWSQSGSILREETLAATRKQLAPAPATADFIKPFETTPGMGKNEPPQDARLAQELKATLDAYGEDLREICRLIKAGRMEYTLSQDQGLIGRCLSPDRKKFVAIALLAEKPPRLAQGEITYYDLSEEVPESYTRRAVVQCQEKNAGVGLYMLNLPDSQASLWYDEAGRLRSFQISRPDKGEQLGIVWTEAGKIDPTKSRGGAK